MERMRGSRWTARVRSENEAFEHALIDATTPGEIEAVTAEFETDAKFCELDSAWAIEGTTRINVYPQPGGEYEWSWMNEKRTNAADLDFAGGLVVYSHMNGTKYEIKAVRREKHLWTHGASVHGVGPSVAIVGRRVYLLEASGPHQYDSLVSLDLNGKDRQVHYEERNESAGLELIRGENGCLFLLSDNSGRQKLFHVGERLKRLSPEACVFHPVGFAPNSKEPCYFTLGTSWEPHGAALQSYRLPAAHGIDAMILRNGVFIHREHGQRFVDLCGRRRGPKHLAKIFGEVLVHPWNLWQGRTGPVDLVVHVPGQSPVRGQIRDCMKLATPRFVYAGNSLTGMAMSADGTRVRWLAVWAGEPKAVIVVGYGAYNTPTHLDTARWKPFIERGFAVAFACVRGGGDHDDAWAKAAQVHNKARSAEDFEACIRAVQRGLGLGPAKTCIFGRSAGGYLVGMAAVRHPDGDLFGSIYTEVPYVDVLKTASNSRLPLTKYEYLEFGDPRHVIADFETLLRLGPVSGLGPRGAPGIFVICRAGLKDKQVYAYESMKWIDVLRGDAEPDEICVESKLLSISHEGHFTKGPGVFGERARDFLLLSKRILS